MKVSERARENARLTTVASDQLGLVTRTQLRDCGVGRGAIEHRIATGTLFRVAPAVYGLGRPTDDPFARPLAAVLAVRGDAWLRGRSSGAAWRLLPDDPRSPVELCVVGGGARSREGVAVRRLSRLDRRDRARRGPLPVLGLARTVIDLAPSSGEDELERIAGEAVAVHGLTARSLGDALGRVPNAPGSAGIRRLLQDGEAPRHTRSEAERLFLALVREAGLPVPRMNVPIGPFVVDAFWEDRGLVAEVDSFRFHQSRERFEKDRARDGDLQVRGLVVTRVTWRQMTERRLATAARLGGLLAVRGLGR